MPRGQGNKSKPGPKKPPDKLLIYIPQSKVARQPVERLMKIGAKKDRSVSYLVVEAILQYLDREENRS